jgi:hypothetical protein
MDMNRIFRLGCREPVRLAKTRRDAPLTKLPRGSLKAHETEFYVCVSGKSGVAPT